VALQRLRERLSAVKRLTSPMRSKAVDGDLGPIGNSSQDATRQVALTAPGSKQTSKALIPLQGTPRIRRRQP